MYVLFIIYKYDIIKKGGYRQEEDNSHSDDNIG